MSQRKARENKASKEYKREMENREKEQKKREMQKKENKKIRKLLLGQSTKLKSIKYNGKARK